MDLSEKQLAYFTNIPIDDPTNPQNGEGITPKDITDSSQVYDTGGTGFLATATFSQGIGPSYENKEEYNDYFKYRGANSLADYRYLDGSFINYSYAAEDDWTIPEEYRFKHDFLLKDSIILPSPAQRNFNNAYSYYEKGTNLIKEQLLDKKGVMIAFCADTSLPNQDTTEGVFIELTNWAHYTWNDAASANHAVTIVGWDDNYPKENFISEHQPFTASSLILVFSMSLIRLTNVSDSKVIYMLYIVKIKRLKRWNTTMTAKPERQQRG